MSTSIRREERKLARILRGALLAALASCGAHEEPPIEEAVEEAESALVSEASCAPVQYTPNPPDTCGKFVHLACGLPAGVKPTSDCYLWLNDCKKICPGAYFNCHATERSCVDGKIVPDEHGVVDIDCVTCAKGVGRVPAGFTASPSSGTGSATGDYLAAAAAMESAAIFAFRGLARDLSRHGAPSELVHAAKAAARDEVYHARAMRDLAARFGAAPRGYDIYAPRGRALDEIALENAVEGCVRETYGALFAAFQAARASDPEIANLMRRIARDEARHAALSWAIATWSAPELDTQTRRSIEEKCREAVSALRREAARDLAAPGEGALGLPSSREQQALIDALDARLWQHDQRPFAFLA